MAPSFRAAASKPRSVCAVIKTIGICRVSLQCLANLISVRPRHHEVEENEIRQFRFGEFDPLVAIGRLDGVGAIVDQHGKIGADILVVIDDEHQWFIDRFVRHLRISLAQRPDPDVTQRTAGIRLFPCRFDHRQDLFAQQPHRSQHDLLVHAEPLHPGHEAR
jgi:hypothetical protein